MGGDYNAWHFCNFALQFDMNTIGNMDNTLNFKSIDGLFDKHCADISVVAVNPVDEHSIAVMLRCLSRGIKRLMLCVADSADVLPADLVSDARVAIVSCTDVDDAARHAVALAHCGEADVIFKGFINTDNLLHAVLDKQVGLLDPGWVMTHITAAYTPEYHKLLLFSDAAVIPYPTEEQFGAMVGYGVTLLHFFGVDTPKVALIHFTEKTNPKFPVTTAYASVKSLAESGSIAGAEIAGPMDVKTACDRHAADIKMLEGCVAGNADMLVFPDLEAANTFYKTISLFGRATMAGIICGCRVPIVIPSRADSVESKFTSLAFACVAKKAFTINE